MGEHCEIVSFFSFKGGTGRSLALANCAFELARRGRRAACVDMDIEAPGLGNIFNVEERLTKGVVDLLLDLRSGFQHALETTVDISDLLGSDGSGALHLLPSLHEEPDRLTRLEWDPILIRDFRSEVIDVLAGTRDLDYVLVDSKSGMTHESVLALGLATSAIVLCFRLDRQSRAGTKFAYDLLSQLGVEQLLVASDVPVQSARAREILLDFEKELGHRVNLVIPSDPDLQLLEEITVETRPEAEVSKCYRDLVDLIEHRRKKS